VNPTKPDSHAADASGPQKDQCRDEFEAWCDKEGVQAERHVRTGVYCYPSARVAWRAWKAAWRPRAKAEATTTRSADASPISKEWCVNMAKLEPDDGEISAGGLAWLCTCGSPSLPGVLHRADRPCAAVRDEGEA